MERTSRIRPASALVAAVATLCLASVALGSTGGKHAAVTKSPIRIVERGNSHPNASFEHRGRFILTLDGVIQDSGRTSIRPSNGADKTVDGQLQEPVFANNTLTSKKGILSISLRGLSIAVSNFEPTKPSFYVEYGTWKIVGGSGMYAGWKGGGRWANAGTPANNNIEWDGFVTHP